MKDINGEKIIVGAIVKPLGGFWKGFTGSVIDIDPEDDSITVLFEKGEDNTYFADQLEVVRG